MLRRECKCFKILQRFEIARRYRQYKVSGITPYRVRANFSTNFTTGSRPGNRETISRSNPCTPSLNLCRKSNTMGSKNHALVLRTYLKNEVSFVNEFNKMVVEFRVRVSICNRLTMPAFFQPTLNGRDGWGRSDSGLSTTSSATANCRCIRSAYAKRDRSNTATVSASRRISAAKCPPENEGLVDTMA